MADEKESQGGGDILNKIRNIIITDNNQSSIHQTEDSMECDGTRNQFAIAMQSA